jgi:hypothetical protein
LLSSSYADISLPKNISIDTTGLTMEFFTQVIIEDLLSSFCMFDTNAVIQGCLWIFMSVVWTNIRKKSITSVKPVFAAPMLCETIIHPKREVVELTVMTARMVTVEE